jgi:hypothetical protein
MANELVPELLDLLPELLDLPPELPPVLAAESELPAESMCRSLPAAPPQATAAVMAAARTKKRLTFIDPRPFENRG